MENDKYYDISNISFSNDICSLEQLNSAITEETEASKIFLYLVNNINNSSYEKVLYMNGKRNNMGLFIFENSEMRELYNCLKQTDVKLSAYLKFDQCLIKYIISENEDGKKDRIIIESGTSKSIYYNGEDFKLVNKCDNKLVIYNDKSIYCDSSKRFFPANLKSICKINTDVSIAILQYYSIKNPFWKDIIRDYVKGLCFCPIPLDLIWESHTKKQLFEKKDKVILYNSINRYSTYSAYLLSKAFKYIDPKEFSKLKILNDEKINKCNSINSLFYKFYKETLQTNNNDDYNYDNYYIEDYCSMVIKMKKKFNMKMKSIKRLIEEHNKLSLEYKIKFVKTIKIPKDSIFKKLKLPPKYKLIKTKKALIEEGILNDNCVASYDTKINKGQCAIYTTFYENKRYTIEIKAKKKKGKYIFYTNQLFGKSNTIAPKELHQELNELLEKENLRI